MDLSNLNPAEGATHADRRKGRGAGSGTGGHSSTKGTKGQKSRSGSHKLPLWFEGGQMPLYRRLPKYGFTSPFRKENRIVNVGRLASMIADGRLDADGEITPETLADAGAVRKPERVKVLGSGEIDDALDVSAHAFSDSAKEKIEAAGGSVTVL
ncbi:MAG: 50S ribosomal protein L15 [Bacteroidetes bacterium QS_1_65_9]|nr:MAG: 50S ribosomal protein L15 [Bacteroidetes bacterium QS_8_68_15]PSQ80080.1 MAG: 50S ribosomal protein L15 [Bacteroidetes bacterium QS_1_65_9]